MLQIMNSLPQWAVSAGIGAKHRKKPKKNYIKDLEKGPIDSSGADRESAESKTSSREAALTSAVHWQRDTKNTPPNEGGWQPEDVEWKKQMANVNMLNIEVQEGQKNPAESSEEAPAGQDGEQAPGTEQVASATGTEPPKPEDDEADALKVSEESLAQDGTTSDAFDPEKAKQALEETTADGASEQPEINDVDVSAFQQGEDGAENAKTTKTSGPPGEGNLLVGEIGDKEEEEGTSAERSAMDGESEPQASATENLLQGEDCDEDPSENSSGEQEKEAVEKEVADDLEGKGTETDYGDTSKEDKTETNNMAGEAEEDEERNKELEGNLGEENRDPNEVGERHGELEEDAEETPQKFIGMDLDLELVEQLGGEAAEHSSNDAQPEVADEHIMELPLGAGPDTGTEAQEDASVEKGKDKSEKIQESDGESMKQGDNGKEDGDTESDAESKVMAESTEESKEVDEQAEVNNEERLNEATDRDGDLKEKKSTEDDQKNLSQSEN